jgi:hypothetical protein
MATKTANEWREECKYISDTTDYARSGSAALQRVALKSFNGDRACFVRYCEMQRDCAARDGQFDAQTYIQECIDDLTAA